MAKRLNFEEIIRQEFRWPQPGDMPFERGDRANAEIQDDPNMRFAAMMEGYKLSADLMVDRATVEPIERNSLVYPIIFGYRHFIELSLKYLIDKYGRGFGIEPIWNSHDLVRLWLAFCQISEQFGADDPDEADDHVGIAVAEFAKIDPRSDSLRYPCTSRGEPIPVGIDELNLIWLREVMSGVGNFFQGCDAYWSEVVNA